jgi:glycosyltransferase involved in cell wall biosynthesis
MRAIRYPLKSKKGIARTRLRRNKGRVKKRKLLLKSNIKSLKSKRMPNGINLIGFVRTETGIGESSRLAARAVQSANIPFGLLNCPPKNNARTMDLSWAHKETKKALYKVNIFHMNAYDLPSVFQYFGKCVVKGRYNIGYWHWELPDFPDEWCSNYRLVDEVWVPSNFTLDSVSRKSSVPVVRIPHGIEVNIPPGLNRNTFGLPENRFLFLSMFDAISVLDRKNPMAVIEAFKMAFGKDDPSAGLVVKITHSYPEAMDLLNRSIQDFHNIHIISEDMERQQVNALIHSTDCAVSLHRAEGFGLLLAEAMYLGKPVIGTNWSGNTDFMNSMNSCTVDYRLVSVGSDHGPYKAYQAWADPDIQHAAYYMKKLVQETEWRNIIAWRGQQTIRNHFSPAIAGEMIKQRLITQNLL